MIRFGKYMAKEQKILTNILRKAGNMEIAYYHLDFTKVKLGGALHKCWIGFVIAKEKMEWDKIDLYAKRIQNIERELGIEVTNFSDWGIE
jgi:ferritin-like protein